MKEGMAWCDVELELRKYEKGNTWGYEVGVLGSERKDEYNVVETIDNHLVLFENHTFTGKRTILKIRNSDEIDEIDEEAYLHAKDVVLDRATKIHLNFEKNKILGVVDNTPRGKLEQKTIEFEN